VSSRRIEGHRPSRQRQPGRLHGLARAGRRRPGPAPRAGPPPHPRLAINASGRLHGFVSYVVTASDERIDLDRVCDLVLVHRPKLIAASYQRTVEAEPSSRRHDGSALHPTSPQLNRTNGRARSRVLRMLADGVCHQPVVVARWARVRTSPSSAGGRCPAESWPPAEKLPPHPHRRHPPADLRDLHARELVALLNLLRDATRGIRYTTVREPWHPTSPRSWGTTAPARPTCSKAVRSTRPEPQRGRVPAPLAGRCATAARAIHGLVVAGEPGSGRDSESSWVAPGFDLSTLVA
jgi:hypothetical protein